MGQRRECMKRRRGIKGRVDRNGNLMVVFCLKPNQPTFQGLQMENGNFVQKDSKPKKKVIATRNLKGLDQLIATRNLKRSFKVPSSQVCTRNHSK